MPIGTTQPIANTFPRLQVGTQYLNYAKVEYNGKAVELQYEGFESIDGSGNTWEEHIYGKRGGTLTFSGALAQDYTLSSLGLVPGTFLTNVILYLNKNNTGLNITWTKLGISNIKVSNDIDADKPVQVSFDGKISGQVIVNL